MLVFKVTMNGIFRQKSVLYPAIVISAMLCNVEAMVNGYQHVPQSVIQDAFQNSRLNQSTIPTSGIGNTSNKIAGGRLPFNPSNYMYRRHVPLAEKQIKQSNTINSSKRTCLEALQSSISNGIYKNYCILDLSNTADFAQNADLVTQQFFTQIQSAGIKCIYMDLYNSSVNDAYINKWNAQFKKNGIRVLWNLSGNETVTDQTIAMLGSLDNIIGLNIAGTQVSDLGVNQLVTMLNSNNPVNLDFINIHGSKISDTGRVMLETNFSNNVNKWNTMYPDRKISGRGIINDLGTSIESKSAGGIGATNTTKSDYMGTTLPVQNTENTLNNSVQEVQSQEPTNVSSVINPILGNSDANIQTATPTVATNLTTTSPTSTEISNVTSGMVTDLQPVTTTYSPADPNLLPADSSNAMLTATGYPYQ